MSGCAERCLTRLLEQLLPADVAEALIGDLLEERAVRARVAGARRAAAWYWGQLVISALPLLHAALRRREFALACMIGVVAYTFASAAENAARESVALVATHTAVDALPVLLVYLPTVVLAAFVAERAREGAAFAFGVLVALGAAVQLVADAYGMPLWYRCVLPFAAPTAAFVGHAALSGWLRRGARRRRSIG